MSKPIIVGIDDTAANTAAQDLAAQEAAMRNLPLRIMHATAWPWPAFHTPQQPEPTDMEAIALLAQANNMLDAVVERVRHTHPGVTVSGDMIIGLPAPVLCAASRAASMVVIGNRSLSTIDRLALGSTATQLAAHAACPVLISRGRPNPSGNVVLFVDKEPASDAAVGAAFVEADLRRCGLDVVHLYRHRLTQVYDDRYSTSATDARERELGNAFARWQDSYADVEVRQQFAYGRARQTLIDATMHARILVVPAQRNGTATRLHLRLANHALLHNAYCPVLVVPHGDG